MSARALLLAGLAACTHDLSSVGEPCSASSACPAEMVCGDDSRCVPAGCTPNVVAFSSVDLTGAGSNTATVTHAAGIGVTTVVIDAQKPESLAVLSVDDTGANTWAKLERITNLGLVTETIWYTKTKAAYASLTLHFGPGASTTHHTIVSDWDCIADDPVDVTASLASGPTPMPSTGPVTTTKRDLVIGTLSFDDGNVQHQVAPPFAGLQAAVSGTLSTEVAYTTLPPGTYSADWTIDTSVQHAAAAIIALHAQP